MQTPTYAGLWTPVAEIICFECHGTTWGSRGSGAGDPIKDFENLCQPRDAEEYESAGLCDRCEKAIWLPEDIAGEQKVVAAIRALKIDGVTAAMQQTGGMCSAAGAFFGGKIVYITNSEDADESNGGLLLGLYANEDALGDGETIDMVDCRTPQEAAEKVREWATGGGRVQTPTGIVATCDCADCQNPVVAPSDERRNNLCDPCDLHGCDGDGPCHRIAEEKTNDR